MGHSTYKIGKGDQRPFHVKTGKENSQNVLLFWPFLSEKTPKILLNFRMRTVWSIALALSAASVAVMGQRPARIGADGKPLLNRPVLEECQKSKFVYPRDIKNDYFDRKWSLNKVKVASYWHFCASKILY